MELLATLGVKASIATGRAKCNGRDYGEKYRIRFYFEEAAYLPRKRERCRSMRSSAGHYLRIDRAGVGDTVCVEVAHPSHTFLAGRAMIPTCNSSKHGDYSAIVLLGRTPDGTLWVEADLQRRVSTQIVEDLLEWQRTFVADGIAIETNQFQELLKDDVERVSSERGIMAPCWGLDNRVNKEVRIRRLTPYLSKRNIRFKANSPGTAMLVQQLRDFPEGEHEEGPDALEGALRLAVSLWNGAGQEAQETVFA